MTIDALVCVVIEEVRMKMAVQEYAMREGPERSLMEEREGLNINIKSTNSQ